MSSDFKGRHFRGDIILWAVRWYCRYGISYRDLEEMLEERGVDLDHTTLYRWVQTFAPEIEKRLRWHWHHPHYSGSWFIDETYIKVKGKWKYLYRAVDKTGATIDFYLGSGPVNYHVFVGSKSTLGWVLIRRLMWCIIQGAKPIPGSVFSQPFGRYLRQILGRQRA